MTEQKAWYQSKTIWGSLIAIIAALMQGFGVRLDPQMQGDAVEALFQASAVIGSLVAIYGRLTAETTIGE